MLTLYYVNVEKFPYYKVKKIQSVSKTVASPSLTGVTFYPLQSRVQEEEEGVLSKECLQQGWDVGRPASCLLSVFLGIRLPGLIPPPCTHTNLPDLLLLGWWQPLLD